MTPGDPVVVFNRRTGRRETEEIYGERFLRWTYETAPGRAALWLAARRAWFSHWYGWRMRRPSSCKRIAPFVRRYGLDPSEFEKPVDRFEHFNAFFCRRLKPGSRPIDPDPRSVVLPADGRHLAFPDASAIDGVFVKGQRFDLEALVGDAELARRHAGGALVVSRLCPVDYHRFHFPLDGVPTRPRLIGGTLASVNPIALRRRLDWFWENKRMLTVIQTPSAGEVLYLEVGATCVGTIRQTFAPGRTVRKGDEKGYFAFGGSTTILLFEPGRVELDPGIIARSRDCIETYDRMGTVLGRVTTP